MPAANKLGNRIFEHYDGLLRVRMAHGRAYPVQGRLEASREAGLALRYTARPATPGLPPLSLRMAPCCLSRCYHPHISPVSLHISSCRLSLCAHVFARTPTFCLIFVSLCAATGSLPLPVSLLLRSTAPLCHATHRALLPTTRCLAARQPPRARAPPRARPCCSGKRGPLVSW